MSTSKLQLLRGTLLTWLKQADSLRRSTPKRGNCAQLVLWVPLKVNLFHARTTAEPAILTTPFCSDDKEENVEQVYIDLGCLLIESEGNCVFQKSIHQYTRVQRFSSFERREQTQELNIVAAARVQAGGFGFS